LIAYAFDIDGVVADVRDRVRVARELSEATGTSFWDLFFSEELIELDRPRDVGVRLVRERSRLGCVVVVTGRPRRLREVSLREFADFTGVKPFRIYMRSDRDFRRSHVVKLELLSRAFRDGLEVRELHDDSEEVLRAVRNSMPEVRLFLHFNNEFRPYT